ncbi:MAG: response regulator [Bacteroidia bacterium]
MKQVRHLFILMIDDDDDDKSLFSEAVEEIDPNIKCVTAKDGKDALEFLKNCNELPDFIFLDLNMPGMNGKKFLEELKKSTRLANIPVVIFCSSGNWDDVEETKNLGASMYLRKPADYDATREAILFVITEQYKKVANDQYPVNKSINFKDN